MNTPPGADEGATQHRAQQSICALIEDLPLPAYLLRAEGGDFILECVNGFARRQSPALTVMVGRPCIALYRDQPEIIEAAFRCMRERRTIFQRALVRRHDQIEHSDTQLVYVYIEPDRLVIYSRAADESQVIAGLQDREVLYQSIVASLPDAMILRSVDGRVLTCNEAAVKLFGQATVADMLGKRQLLVEGQEWQTEAGLPITAEDYPSFRVLRTGLPVLGEVYKLKAEDGTARFVRVSSQPVFARSGAIGGSVSLFTDVTDRLRLEEELRRAQRLESIGRLAGGVAHDFNNLLTAMLGSIELLSDLCPPSAAEDLQTIRHGAERARELTSQLLSFARKQPIVLEVVDLGALVVKVERLLRRLVGPSVDLAITADRDLCVRADAAQLEQVLVNLVANARDAMPSGGRLEIRVALGVCADRGECVRLEVEDQGVGIAAETLRHIFDPFFSTKAQGIGLGLASSYGIVKQHGGDISVVSEVGRGTRFRVSLPRVRGREQPEEAAPQVVSGRGLVLVVDDDEVVRSTTGRMLSSLGYEALLATDAEHALDLVRLHAGEIDLLLCDVAMPGRSGPEVARDVLALCASIQVLFISGYPEGQETVVSRHGFLQKPYTRASLGAKLSALLDSTPRAVVQPDR